MNNFRRIEQKYILTEDEYKKLMSRIKSHIKKDIYYESTVCNIYFDNDRNDLIINSIEKPVFKQKVRIRSYKVPKKEDNVFLELKAKTNGIVYKRRTELKLKDFYKYLDTKELPKTNNDQIMKEIDYLFNQYDLKPKLFLAYDRKSFCSKDDETFRITFDENLRSRSTDLILENGDQGTLFTEDKMYIMEIKSLMGMPNWLYSVLSELKIYNQSFSKIGSIYQKFKEEEYV